MVVAVAGAHGQIAARLTALLAGRDDRVIGLIRNPDHAGDLESQGAVPVICDLERASVGEVSKAIEGAEAGVFAAGAGPGSGAERKMTMDRDGAIRFLTACSKAGVTRFLIVSSVGAEDPPAGDGVFSVYLRAKAEADQAVRASDLDWVIVRPGRLTDDPGQGRVRIDTEPFRGEIPRDDVAGLLARLLSEDRVSHRVLYVNSGPELLDQALEAVVGS